MDHSPLAKQKSLGAATFFLALGMGFLLFLPFVLYDKGIFVFLGDYNAQQIPFYQLAHNAVRAGEFGWNWNTDLGANFIGSYSFYLLGSPFFWLTLPFPAEWTPYLMAPLLMLKMAFASLTAYAYTRRFLRPQYAMLAGILYGFCGFSIYNIFFNHFHEALIWFPLMLLGVEQHMKDGRKGLFAVAVLFSALNNYYFFIGQAVFIMIYWVVRAVSGEFEHPVRRFFSLWLEALLGTAAAAVLLLPSYLAVIQNGRTDKIIAGWDMMIYNTKERLYDIIHSFFFPPELPAYPDFFPDANNKWASMSAWVPVFGCTGAIAYFQSRRYNDWLKRMLTVLSICAVVPVFNAAFQLFNQVYYARWYYMFTLMLILATLLCFEREERTPVHWGRAIGWAGGVTAFFAIFIGLAPKSWSFINGTEILKIGLEKTPLRFWIYVAIAAVCLLVTGVLVAYFRHRKTEFFAVACAFCVGISLAGGWGYIAMGKAYAYYPSAYITDKLVNGGNFTLPEEEIFSRADMNKGMDNQGMYWGLPTIQAFHSIVPGSVMEFYESVGVARSVGSRPDNTHYALRGLLSVRWLFDYTNPEGDIRLKNKKESDAFMKDGETAMPGWAYSDTKDGFAIYENENFVPMGFTYPGYITRDEYDELSKEDRELALLQAIVLEEDGVADTSLPHIAPDSLDLYKENYAEHCASRAATAASSFVTDRNGFSATINMTEENLVFFSVPYEDGWSATVNGKPAKIIRCNVGFMAVLCPAGYNVDIRFTYKTPGLQAGIIISCVALILLALFEIIATIAYQRRRKAAQKEELPMLMDEDERKERPILLPQGYDAKNVFNINSLYRSKPDKADGTPSSSDHSAPPKNQP